MTLSLSLSHAVDLNTVKVIAEMKPDELAPQLSLVIRELLEDEARHVGVRGISFIRSTVLTETFKEMLREVFTSLRNNTSFTAWLNLDMGSGKTHLLVLLTYLIYSYRHIKEELKEYESFGLDENIANETALFVVDLRTPSEVPTTFLLFFVKSLRRVAEHDAADYVESCIKDNKMPEAFEVVRRLKRRNTKIVAIIDELHHAVLTYRGAQTERKWVGDVIEFVTSLVNYLRHYGRGFAVLVASARRDYERLNQLPEKDALILLAENLVSQIGRLKLTSGTSWISVEDAKNIILKRIGARQNVIHDTFNELIERVIKAESDIPQAQHLRSLIKAMAVYTLNAVDMGHNMVTPLSFSEKVIDALFPEGGGVADKYKSAYNHARRVIEEFRGVEEVERDIALLIVNAIFTASITGRSDLLIEIIKAYKTGSRSGAIPAISERELERLLRDVGIWDPLRVSRALEIVNNVEYVHSIKRGTTYIYFVVPIVSVIAVYNKDINERYGNILVDREDLINRFISYLYTFAGRVGKSFQVVVVSSHEDLERATRGLKPDILYLVVYADPELIRYLGERIKATQSIDIAAELSNWMLAKTGRDIPRWLEEHQRYNVVVTVPVPLDEVLSGIARYYAIEGATSKVVNEYLLEIVKAGSKLQEEMRKLIEVELDEIHRALSDRLVEALSLFTKAYSKALSHVVYVYSCSYELSSGIVCKAVPKSLDTVGLDESRVKQPVSVRTSEEEYAKLIDTLCNRRDKLIENLFENIVERVKKLANFVDSENVARDLVLREVLRSLKDSGEYRLSSDMNTFVHGSQILYVPPSIVDAVARSISAEELEKKLKEQVKTEDIKVAKKEEGGTSVFEVIKKPAILIQETAKLPQLPAEKREVDRVAEALKALDSYERGEVRIVLNFDGRSKNSIKTYVVALKTYIKELEVKPL